MLYAKLPVLQPIWCYWFTVGRPWKIAKPVTESKKVKGNEQSALIYIWNPNRHLTLGSGRHYIGWLLTKSMDSRKKKKKRQKALRFERLTKVCNFHLFLNLITSQNILFIHPRIKIFCFRGVQISLSLSLILLGTSVKGNWLLLPPRLRNVSVPRKEWPTQWTKVKSLKCAGPYPSPASHLAQFPLRETTSVEVHRWLLQIVYRKAH
jgi:hypothetical protein